MDINSIKLKFKIYGLKNFIIFGFIEIFRTILRKLNISYSQFREDMYISKILNKKIVSYIDIGANDPIKFNNTYKFYKRGGRGIIIEPNQNLINKISRLRPHDQILNIGLGDKKSTQKFYIIDPDVNSTFNQRSVSKLLQSGCELISTPKVKIYTLENIFKKYIKKNWVDTISIDTEGYDYKILQGNNWQKYRAKIIIIESDTTNTKQFLNKNGYVLQKKIGLNSIYVNTY